MNKKEYPKLPKTVYKYRSWGNEFHQKVLTENQLFLASPKDFNDPFDCRVSRNFNLLNTDEKKLEYVEKLILKHSKTIKARGYNLDKEKKRMLDELNGDISIVQKRDNSVVFSLQDDHVGVLSLSARYDSILMWSHYADYHKGFCIGFNEKKLRESNLFGMGGMVAYDKDFPEIDPRDDSMGKAFVQTHSKSCEWDYEQEYRLTKYFYPDLPNNENRIVSFPDHFIENFVLGIRICDSDKKEIKKIAKKKNIPVFQAKQIPFQFKIIKEPSA